MNSFSFLRHFLIKQDNNYSTTKFIISKSSVQVPDYWNLARKSINTCYFCSNVWNLFIFVNNVETHDPVSSEWRACCVIWSVIFCNIHMFGEMPQIVAQRPKNQICLQEVAWTPSELLEAHSKDYQFCDHQVKSLFLTHSLSLSPTYKLVV